MTWAVDIICSDKIHSCLDDWVWVWVSLCEATLHWGDSNLFNSTKTTTTITCAQLQVITYTINTRKEVFYYGKWRYSVTANCVRNLIILCISENCWRFNVNFNNVIGHWSHLTAECSYRMFIEQIWCLCILLIFLSQVLIFNR